MRTSRTQRSPAAEIRTEGGAKGDDSTRRRTWRGMDGWRDGWMDENPKP